MDKIIFIIITLIAIFVIIYRKNAGKNMYKYIITNVSDAYNKYAPYSFEKVRKKIKELGQDYTVKEYASQILIFSIGAFVVSYLYFYDIIVSIVYCVVAIMIVPYLSYLRCKRLYSEFIFEQVQVYTTNVIMEFGTTQSFVKALEGVYESNVLDEPFKSDVKVMIDMAYANGTIEESINYMNKKYDYFVIKNMHQLFLQITNEGAKDSNEALENMSLDIDMLVENVYRDRIDRAAFHKKFIQFGLVLYLMVMLVQFLLGVSTYIGILDQLYIRILLHGILIVNTYFLLNGEKYYNENVGAE